MKLFINLPALITEVAVKEDNIVRMKVEVNEIPADDMAVLFRLKKSFGTLSFRESPMTEIELLDLPDVKQEGNQKSPSQRLRAVIYLLGIKNKKYTKDEVSKSNDYYNEKMEYFINSVKEKLT